MRCAANEPNPVAWVITVLLSDEATPVHVTILRQQEDDWVSLDKQMRRVDIRPYLPLNNTLLPVPSQAKPAQQGVTGDKDGDGIPDTEDACPDEAGVYSLNPYENGCPEKKK